MFHHFIFLLLLQIHSLNTFEEPKAKTSCSNQHRLIHSVHLTSRWQRSEIKIWYSWRISVKMKLLLKLWSFFLSAEFKSCWCFSSLTLKSLKNHNERKNLCFFSLQKKKSHVKKEDLGIFLSTSFSKFPPINSLCFPAGSESQKSRTQERLFCSGLTPQGFRTYVKPADVRF